MLLYDRIELHTVGVSNVDTGGNNLYLAAGLSESKSTCWERRLIRFPPLAS